MVNSKSRLANSNDGFTMIEMIIYIGIVGMFLTAISLMALEVSSGQAKTLVTQEVQQNLRLANQLLIQDIQAAADITSPTVGGSGNTLILDNGALDAITYTINGNVLTRQIGGNPPVEVTTDNVVTTAAFENLSYNNRSRNVGVTLNVSFNNPSGISDFDANSNVTYAVELKGRR
ncbi:MAG: hypothetical protein COT81_05660 [Candidatus Buchananbacteria bacterium CG10_big_fil_rev_8_21_14_0_10_42_9]|uniref:Type II secretion system protein n=1 Tax=Candidatus Buchananbacteria bacterium CG10_big_fil_rev_8_21_14_0_10_42_9 TaxID=1974526 RepID=A0A2H0VZS4_9BACT|nr:MAG: hypothetical protein COT81_05660 [Candidatus Buchananbacteria bacterium CG10_big_fil_rev_8_21_14_0_10_42_9]